MLLAHDAHAALDVTIQAQVPDLMADLAQDIGTGVILVTQDPGVVARLCDRVILHYGGRIIEQRTAVRLFAMPAHPCAKGLLHATPRLTDALPPSPVRRARAARRRQAALLRRAAR